MIISGAFPLDDADDLFYRGELNELFLARSLPQNERRKWFTTYFRTTTYRIVPGIVSIPIPSDINPATAFASVTGTAYIHGRISFSQEPASFHKFVIEPTSYAPITSDDYNAIFCPKIVATGLSNRITLLNGAARYVYYEVSTCIHSGASFVFKMNFTAGNNPLEAVHEAETFLIPSQLYGVFKEVPRTTELIEFDTLHLSYTVVPSERYYIGPETQTPSDDTITAAFLDFHNQYML